MDDFFSKYGMVAIAVLVTSTCLQFIFATVEKQKQIVSQYDISQSLQSSHIVTYTDRLKYTNFVFELKTPFIKVHQGEFVQLSDYIIAKHDNGEDMRHLVNVIGTVNTNQAGYYKVEYHLCYKSQEYIKTLQIAVLEETL